MNQESPRSGKTAFFHEGNNIPHINQEALERAEHMRRALSENLG